MQADDHGYPNPPDAVWLPQGGGRGGRGMSRALVTVLSLSIASSIIFFTISLLPTMLSLLTSAALVTFTVIIHCFVHHFL